MVLSFKISRQAWGAELWIISEQIVNVHSKQKHLQGELCWNKWQIKKYWENIYLNKLIRFTQSSWLRERSICWKQNRRWRYHYSWLFLTWKTSSLLRIVFRSQSIIIFINFLIKVSIVVTCSLWKCWLWWSFSTPFATSPSISSGWEYLNISMSQYRLGENISIYQR